VDAVATLSDDFASRTFSMTARITPVSFLNRDGLQLFGMLHQPAQPRADGTAILLLSPGVKMRVAPHRLYTKLADRFVALGYPVLRFDFHALGDAGGSAPEALLADFYQATQLGRYVGDTVTAMNWMQREYGTKRFIAAGLCGGALTGLLTAAQDPRIVALLGLSIPVILDGSNVDASKFMTDWQLHGNRARYLRKLRLWDPTVWRSWVRLASGRSHYSLILRAVTRPFVARLERANPPAAVTSTAPADNTNPLFAPALLGMLRDRQVLLIFGATDRLLAEFEVKFRQRHATAFAQASANCQIHVTPAGNHIFSFGEWQRDMLDRCCEWLQQNPATPVPAGVDDSALAMASHRS
jgi:hypothetical protein